MSTTYEIPLTPEPQTFTVRLGDVAYQLTVTYRDVVGGGWILDIADTTGAPLVCGLPLITGADLLAQHKHLGIGGELWVSTDGDLDAVPTFDNLGLTSHLFLVAP